MGSSLSFSRYRGTILLSRVDFWRLINFVMEENILDFFFALNSWLFLLFYFDDFIYKHAWVLNIFISKKRRNQFQIKLGKIILMVEFFVFCLEKKQRILFSVSIFNFNSNILEFLFFLFCSAIPCILKHFFHAHNNTKFTAFFPTKKNQNFKHLNIEYIEIFWMMHKILKRENNQILCLAFVFRLLHLPNVKFAYFFNFVRKNYAKWNGMVKWRKRAVEISGGESCRRTKRDQWQTTTIENLLKHGK